MAKKDFISLAEVILRHSFPNGNDKDGMPMFRMKHPDVDYVMDIDLKKVIRVIGVEKTY